MRETIIAKLISGEMVVGIYTHPAKEVLEDCYTLLLQQSREGVNIHFMPYMMPFEKDGSTIDSKYILKEIPATDDLVAEYVKVKTGIILDSKPGIIL